MHEVHLLIFYLLIILESTYAGIRFQFYTLGILIWFLVMLKGWFNIIKEYLEMCLLRVCDSYEQKHLMLGPLDNSVIVFASTSLVYKSCLRSYTVANIKWWKWLLGDLQLNWLITKVYNSNRSISGPTGWKMWSELIPFYIKNCCS